MLDDILVTCYFWMVAVLFEATIKMQNLALPGTTVQMCDYRYY